MKALLIYRKNLMNRGFGKEASQNSSLEQATIVRAQGASEDKDFEKQPTLPKTDSSGSFGIIGVLCIASFTTPIFSSIKMLLIGKTYYMQVKDGAYASLYLL
jgi:hypothetical protein